MLERVRQLGAHPALEPGVALVLRGLTVRESARFLLHELRGRGGSRGYRLRHSNLIALVRHGTPDVVTLGEVFHRPDYALPAAVDERLPRDRAIRVLDLGGNIGLFGLWALGERPLARLTSFEPDPANAELLREVVAVNGAAATWEVVEAAAAAESGTLSFRAGDFAVSRVAEGGVCVRSVDVLPLLADADLAKLDIEGGEWAILCDPRFPELAPPSIVLEYHPHLAPAGRPPRAVLEQALDRAGYVTAAVFHRDDGHGLVWGWRT